MTNLSFNRSRQSRSSSRSSSHPGTETCDALTVMSLLSSGVHQYSGHLPCTLFASSAATSINTVPSNTSGNASQPSPTTVGSVATSKAVAPAGGYTVCVRDIRTDEMATDNAPASQEVEERYGGGASAKSLAMPMPMMELRSCPKKAGRGCEAGEVGRA